MNKLKYLFISFVVTQSLALANYNDIFIADIQYDWINKPYVEKQVIIDEIRDIIFKDGEIPKNKDLKKEFKDLIQDKEYKKHYIAASAGLKEYENYNISAFYYKKQKHIYMYALQDKQDLSKIFYYDALGNLRYIDFIQGEFPDYPYYAIQYRITGTPVSAVYNVSKDTQYLYNPDSSFKGVWYKHNLYDENSKIILKRTTY